MKEENLALGEKLNVVGGGLEVANRKLGMFQQHDEGLQRELEAKQREVDILHSKLDIVGDSLEIANRKLDVMEEEHENLTQICFILKKENAGLASMKDSEELLKRGDIERERERSCLLANEKAFLEKRVEVLTEEAEQLRGASAKLRDEAEKLKAAIADANELGESQAERIGRLEASAETSKTAVAAAERFWSEAEDNCEDMAVEADSLRRELDEANQRLAEEKQVSTSPMSRSPAKYLQNCCRKSFNFAP